MLFETKKNQVPVFEPLFVFALFPDVKNTILNNDYHMNAKCNTIQVESYVTKSRQTIYIANGTTIVNNS